MGMLSKLIPVIRKISEYQPPGKTALQKLIYLMERKDLLLGFDFSIHYYGPYSSELDDTVRGMQMQGVVEIVPDGMIQRIHLTELSEMVESVTLTQADEQTIEKVLEVFGRMSANELELITTTDFVARQLSRGQQTCTDVTIIEGVKKIKGNKYSNEKISDAISILKQNGYEWN